MGALETDLTAIAARALQQRDDYDAFGHYLDIMWEHEQRSDAELDALVDAIAAEVIPQLDCTACANCCRSLVVGLTPADIPPLAAALHRPPDKVIVSFIDRTAGEREGEWGVFRCSPCPLLRHNLCSVYAHRPQSCRDYPALTPDFRWLYPEIARGAGSCPIIFHVIERLQARLGW